MRERKPRPQRTAQESAELRRRRNRTEAAQEQERRALELFIQGKTYGQIQEAMGVAYGTAWTYVNRGLRRRADMDGEIATKARSMLQMQIEALMGSWMPLALGGARTRDGETLPPDPRAADVMDKLIRRYGEITGALAPIRVEGEVTTRPLDPEAAVDMIMAGLQRIADKDKTIEGHLASAGHTRHELTTGERSDALPPPFQEKAT